MRKLKQRGALFIEYALVMAFVTAIGASFISDNFFAKEINDIFNRVAKVKVLTADVKASLQEYTYNVAVALTHKYDVLGQEVRQYMGGIVTQYSPVEARIIRAVDEAVGKAVDKVTKEKDAEFAKQKAEFAKQKAQDQATIENLRAEIERLKAERSA